MEANKVASLSPPAETARLLASGGMESDTDLTRFHQVSKQLFVMFGSVGALTVIYLTLACFVSKSQSTSAPIYCLPALSLLPGEDTLSFLNLLMCQKKKKVKSCLLAYCTSI